MSNDFLNADILRSTLGDDFPLAVRYADLTASTNLDAKNAFLSGADEATLFVAGEQSGGRGRLGRSFYSPAGSGVYFSLLFPSVTPAESLLSLTCSAGVSVRRGILSVTGCDTKIKWVNDLRYRDKKVCGILAESLTLGDKFGLVLGVGINLRPIDFPPELRDTAGSLDNTACRRSDLICACVKELYANLFTSPELWIDEYRQNSCTIGKSVKILQNGEEIARGVAEDVRTDGALLLKFRDGTLTPIRSGEVSVR